MNMGHVLPVPGFLEGLRELTRELGALLIYDEVKTGAKYFRGAAGRFGVAPDMMLLGKSIACGSPLSAIAGAPGVLDRVGPRRIPHAGTFNANPLSIACCRATLDHILTEENLARASALNARLARGYSEILRDHHVTAHVSSDGPSGTVFFSEAPVRDWRSFLQVDGERSMLYYFLGLNRDLIPSGTGPDEQWTVSTVHRATDIDRHLAIVASYADELTGAPVVGEIEESV
jgi:glutamate-1-semialdehyde 2,1-aminomutase